MAKASNAALNQFINSIVTQESGGNYGAQGAPVNGDRAYGKYQIMGANIPSWTQAALGHSLTPAQFLADPAAQDKVARWKLASYYKAYGPRGAAAAWYSGNPALQNDTSPQPSGPSVKEYVDSVMSRASSAPTTSSAVGAVAGQATPNPQQHYNPQTLAEQFGYEAAFFDTDPSLKQWMGAALNGTFGDMSSSIGQNRALAALHATKWFQTHTTAQQQWQNLLTSRPAEAKQQIAQKTQDVLLLARQEGVTLDAMTASQIAKSALANGLDDTHLKVAVDSHAAYHANVAFGGQLGQIHDQYAQLASQYGVDLSDQTLSQWAVNTLQGKQTDQDFLNLIKQQSSSKYAGMAPQIAAGVTPQQIADNYRQSMANLLEVNPDSIDWKNDPLIQQALQYQPDQKSGTTTTPTTMPVWQFEQQVKQDPRWQFTDNAKQTYLTAISRLGRDWGFA